MKLKRAASAAMAAAMTMSTAAPTVLAAENPASASVDPASGESGTGRPQATMNGSDQQSTIVYAAVNGHYVLTVPESINLHKANKADFGSGTYVNDKQCKVNLRGDIGYDQVVTVAVTDSVMKCAGSPDQKANVDISSKSVWNRDDLFAGAVEEADGGYSEPTGSSTVYPVSAKLTPGDWVGTVTFNCTLSNVPTMASIVTGITPTVFDYDGREHSPGLVFANGVTLEEGVDYEISGDKAKSEEGKYSITITALGKKHVGNVTYDWEIKKYDISGAVSGLDQTEFEEDGTTHTPTINWNNTTLHPGVDYEITGTPSASGAGEYTITITGIGKYKGSIDLPWKVVARTEISEAAQSITPDHFDYDGQRHTPEIVWNDGFKNLQKGVDYEISGDVNKSEEGTYTITVAGIGKYKGKATFNWSINKYDINGAVSGLDQTVFENDGTTHKPNIQWNEGFEDLVKDKDYTITGTPSASGDGNYTVTITGIGKYKSSIDLPWKVVTYTDISLAAKGLNPESFDYDGNKHSPELVWNTGFENMVKDKDYTVSGDFDKSEEGKYSITVTGKGDYKGTTTFNWEIKRYDIAGAVKGLDENTFKDDGTEHTPNIQWNPGFEGLVKDKDYTITGTPTATGEGEYTITVTGIGKYKGEITLNWKVEPIPEISTAIAGITPEHFDYDEQEHSPAITWNAGFEDLVLGVDYEISGDTTKSACGDYTLTVTGIGNYKGSATFNWNIRELIPVNAVYTIKKTGEQLTGDGKSVYFPLKAANGDTYVDEDYAYTWSVNWAVVVRDKTKVSYGQIRSYICDRDITSLYMTFKDCTNMTEAPAIPDSVTNMSSTFLGCKQLTAAPTIPNSVTDMGSTFNNCSNLTVAPAIPAGVTNIHMTFYFCRSLKSYVGSTDADGDFSGYRLPNGASNMYRTFYSCEQLVIAPIIPNNVTKMEETFAFCSKLSVAPAIPNSVTTARSTFTNCGSLKSYIGSTDPDGDFSNYKISNNATDMGYTFSACRQIVIPPVIPNSVTTMTQTFSGCSKLTIAPIIPNGVISMMGTFSSCNSLKSHAGSTAPDGDFSGYKIPDGVTNMDSTFYSCTLIKKAPAIPASVITMGEKTAIEGNVCGTFQYCRNLTGTLICNANPTTYAKALEGTQITAIEGSCTEETKQALLATR